MPALTPEAPEETYTEKAHILAHKSSAEILNYLLESEPYRQFWEQYVQRRRNPGINIRAVATHLAAELSDIAEEELNPEHFKDTVRRALSGALLTGKTINRFGAAFSFSEDEMDLLWAAHVREYLLSYAGKDFPEDVEPSNDPAKKLITLSAHVEVTCDRYGLIRTIVVTENIMSLVEGLQYIKPFVETRLADMSMLEGGVLKSSPPTADGIRLLHENNSFHTLLIELSHPLKLGEIHRQILKININETHDDNEDFNSLQIESRVGPIFNMSISLAFDEAPSWINRCSWDEEYEDQPLFEEPLAIEKKVFSSYHRLVHTNMVGFTWGIRELEK